MMANRALMAALALLALPVLASAQGLGDAAKSERDRRAKAGQPTQEPGKVYSNEDLNKGRPPADSKDGAQTQSQPPSASSGNQPALETSVEPSATELIEQKANREKEFEAAIDAARARVAEIEKHMNELAARLDVRSTTFVHGAGGSLDVNEEARIRAELAEQPARLEAAKRAVAAAEEALVDFQNGRADAVPGGRSGE
jgi:hypothetical protein